MASIYRVVNNITKKSYIGQTIRPVHSRWKQHTHTKTQDYFHRAIQKHGKDCWTIEVLEEISKELLNEREIYWINFYKTTNEDYGYNMTFGGEGSIPTEDTKKKLSLAKKGKPSPHKGKPLSEEHRLALCKPKSKPAWNKGLKTGKPSWNRGIPCSEEAKIKSRNKQLGIPLKERMKKNV